MKVSEVMSNNLTYCMATDTAQHVAEMMKRSDVGSVPIMDVSGSRRLVGTVTDRDLCLKVIGRGLPASTPIQHLMTRHVITCHVDDSLERCEGLMRKHQLRRIPVVDGDGLCVGMVAQADVALHDNSQHIQMTLREISRPVNGAMHAHEAVLARA
ncbi:CBS domain-containing protein [Terriglobus sp. ADX1]